MVIGDDVHRLLTLDPAVSALVSTRVFPNWIPKDADMPAVRYAVFSELPVLSVEGYTSGLTHVHVQVDAYAQTYREAELLADACEGVLGSLTTSGLCSVQAGRRDLYEEDVLLHRVSITFSMWKGTTQ